MVKTSPGVHCSLFESCKRQIEAEAAEKERFQKFMISSETILVSENSHKMFPRNVSTWNGIEERERECASKRWWSWAHGEGQGETFLDGLWRWVPHETADRQTHTHLYYKSISLQSHTLIWYLLESIQKVFHVIAFSERERESEWFRAMVFVVEKSLRFNFFVFPLFKLVNEESSKHLPSKAMLSSLCVPLPHNIHIRCVSEWVKSIAFFAFFAFAVNCNRVKKRTKNNQQHCHCR